jgi:N-acetylglutamate synthase-like GNAT family acetyltransferase
VITKEEFSLRHASREDDPAIKKLVRGTGINPFGLDWRRFILAVDSQDQLVGCGQVRLHHDGSRELASIAVCPEWRRQGAARAIIERLVALHSQPLYLTCRAELGPFYEKFGFRRVDSEEMGAYFRRLSRLLTGFGPLQPLKDRFYIMKRGN